MKAEIISIGTELLLGEITDTNASYLASQLPMLGIDLYWVSQVGDNQKRLVEVLKRAWGRSDLILTSGGLGPTEDDLTREAVAEMLGEKLEVAPELEHEITEFFARRSVEMPRSNIKQATLIPSATAIHNLQGTAPGWWVEKSGHILVALPGPPGEMQPIWQTEVMPKLRQRIGGSIIFSRVIKTFGLSEAAVGELLSSLFSSVNPTLAIYAKADGIHLRLTAKAKSQNEAGAMIKDDEDRIKLILGEYIWGTDGDRLEVLVGNLLKEKHLSLATMESCSGGLLSSAITDAPGSSNYFRGGVVAYCNEIKTACGVSQKLIADYGAVSPEAAGAMAQAARSSLKADIGVGVTGVAGPDELEGKPVGTVYIGIDDGNKKKVATARYPGDRTRIKHRAATAALVELTKFLSTQ